MKITHNKIGQNLNLVDGAKSEKTDKTKSSKNASEKGAASSILSSGAEDASRVEVSPRAMEAKKIKDLANAAPDVDMEKVAKFRKLIDEGKYQVDAKAVADKMVDDHLETMN